ncbi:hypothetical protein GQ53DRAFT_832638 [Thozetella sp. PMI_491]|nr:hypothetical protein GQ53DRAFT_832638 [Thozetella sp. PMI_491]
MPDSTDHCKEVSPDCPVEATVYGYVPNLGGNAFYAVVFAICALIQCYYIFRFWRLWKGFSVLTCVGCVGECCGYIGRLFLHKNPWNGAALPIQLVLLMVSPSFLAAALYTTLRKLVQHFGPEHTRLPARFWTWPFVTADLLGFFLQCGGGILAAMGDANHTLASVGNTLMVFGVSFQAAIMVIAATLTADFALRISRRHGAYVIPEMAGGVGGTLMRQEADFMIFDGLMILLAVVLQSAVHPGIFAYAMQNSTVHLYELKAPLVLSDRPETHNLQYSHEQP